VNSLDAAQTVCNRGSRGHSLAREVTILAQGTQFAPTHLFFNKTNRRINFPKFIFVKKQPETCRVSWQK